MRKLLWAIFSSAGVQQMVLPPVAQFAGEVGQTVAQVLYTATEAVLVVCVSALIAEAAQFLIAKAKSALFPEGSASQPVRRSTSPTAPESSQATTPAKGESHSVVGVIEGAAESA